jgi:hypothetical protein
MSLVSPAAGVALLSQSLYCNNGTAACPKEHESNFDLTGRVISPVRLMGHYRDGEGSEGDKKINPGCFTQSSHFNNRNI